MRKDVHLTRLEWQCRIEASCPRDKGNTSPQLRSTWGPCLCLLIVAWLTAQCSPTLTSSGPTVDEIIQRNITAKGGTAKLNAIQSLESRGKVAINADITATVTIQRKRPNRFRLDMTVQGLTATQAFDGSKAWYVMPFPSNGRSEEDIRGDITAAADFDGPLINHSAKGTTLALVTNADGSYTVKVSAGIDSEETFQLDPTTMLEKRQTRTRHGVQEVETTYTKYRIVEGVAFPVAMTIKEGGTPLQTLILDEIKINVPIDDERFVDSKNLAAAPKR